jgi:hypothetical protein
MENGQLHSSVAIFRLRCHRVMTIWTREWLTAYRGSNPADAGRWALHVLFAYTTVLRRSPSIAEWVADILYVSGFAAAPDVIKNIVAARRLPPAVKLQLARPYLMRLHLHKQDMEAALQAWSRDVGRAFFEAHHRSLSEPFPNDRNWTDPTVIRDFIAQTKEMSRPTFYLTKWLERCKLLWKSVVAMTHREHLRPQP